jgi:hypothetical protein
MKTKSIFFSAAAISAAAFSASFAFAAPPSPVSGGSIDFAAAYPGATVNDAYPSCVTRTVKGGQIEVIPPTPGANCNIRPDEQMLAIYSIKLCRNKPSAPSLGAVSDLSSCQAIFDSTNSVGSEISIKLDETTALTNGTVRVPDAGTYTHLYVELNPEVKIKSLAKFSKIMASTNGTSSGLYCWSKQASTYNFASNYQGSLPDATECGSEAATIFGPTSVFFNSLSDDSGSGGTGFVTTMTNIPTTAGGPSTLDAFLIGTDSKLVAQQEVNSMGDVKRLVGIITLPNGGVTVNAATTGLVIGYNNTLGSQISTQSGVNPSQISKFGNGPFDATVTTVPPAPPG